MMMPYFQVGILIAGCTGFGAYICGPGLIYAIMWLTQPPPGQMWGSGLLLIVILFAGSLTGAVAGFRSGMRHFGQRGVQPWGIGGWGGAALGLALGLLLCQTHHLQWIALLLSQMLRHLFLLGVLAFLAAAGGMAGNWLEARWRRQSKQAAGKKTKRVRKNRKTVNSNGE